MFAHWTIFAYVVLDMGVGAALSRGENTEPLAEMFVFGCTWIPYNMFH